MYVHSVWLRISTGLPQSPTLTVQSSCQGGETGPMLGNEKTNVVQMNKKKKKKKLWQQKADVKAHFTQITVPLWSHAHGFGFSSHINIILMNGISITVLITLKLEHLNSTTMRLSSNIVLVSVDESQASREVFIGITFDQRNGANENRKTFLAAWVNQPFVRTDQWNIWIGIYIQLQVSEVNRHLLREDITSSKSHSCLFTAPTPARKTTNCMCAMLIYSLHHIEFKWPLSLLTAALKQKKKKKINRDSN